MTLPGRDSPTVAALHLLESKLRKLFKIFVIIRSENKSKDDFRKRIYQTQGIVNRGPPVSGVAPGSEPRLPVGVQWDVGQQAGPQPT